MSPTAQLLTVLAGQARWYLDDARLEPLLRWLLDLSQGGLLLQGLALVLAVGMGAAHALGPGHGKLLVGAYLAGTDGRVRDAVALGWLVATMHTASVLVLGLVLYLAQRAPSGDRVEAGFVLVSGVAVGAVGLSMVVRQLRRRRHAGRDAPHTAVPTPARAVAGGRPDRPLRDADGPGRHHHVPAGVAPLSRSGVLALASSGGLVPSPGAFVVLATAFAVGRSGLGLALVAAFGLGLAVTLTAVGLAVLLGRTSLTRAAGRRPRLQRAVAWTPLVAGGAVTAGGAVLVWSALLRL